MHRIHILNVVLSTHHDITKIRKIVLPGVDGVLVAVDVNVVVVVVVDVEVDVVVVVVVVDVAVVAKFLHQS